MKSARLKAYLALAAAALIWGAAQPIIKPALDFVTPLQFLFLRYLVAFPIGIGALIYTLKAYRPSKAALLIMLGIEVITITNLMILYNGLQHTTALQSSLILNARPIFITIMGIWLLHEREEKHEWLGLLLSLLGIGMVIVSPYLNHSSSVPISMHGNVLIVMTNLIATANTYFVKKMYKGIPKLFIASVNSIYGLFFLGVLTYGNYGAFPLPALSIQEVLVPVLYMGILGTLIAQALTNYGFLAIEASEATLFHYLEPLVYIPLAVFWLKEPLLPLQLIGLVVIICGVIVAAARVKTPKNKFLRHAKPLLRLIRLSETPTPTHPHILR